MALLPNHSRCSFHSLPGAISRYAARTWRICSQRVPFRLGSRRSVQNRSNCSLRHSRTASQHAPHCRGRRSLNAERETRHALTSDSGAPILREQSQRPRFARRFIEHPYCLAPSRGLRRIDLSQIQNLALHHPAIVETPILHDVPVDVRLAVFFAPGLPQKHDGANLGASTRPGKWVRSSLQRFSPILGCPGPIKSIACVYPTAQKSLLPPANPRRRANPDEASHMDPTTRNVRGRAITV